MSDNWVVQNLENALNTWNEKLAEIWQLVTHNKEQHEQGKSNSLHRTVNIHDDIPYRASLKVLWGLGNELPYLG